MLVSHHQQSSHPVIMSFLRVKKLLQEVPHPSPSRFFLTSEHLKLDHRSTLKPTSDGWGGDPRDVKGQDLPGAYGREKNWPSEQNQSSVNMEEGCWVPLWMFLLSCKLMCREKLTKDKTWTCFLLKMIPWGVLRLFLKHVSLPILLWWCPPCCHGAIISLQRHISFQM